MIVIRAAVLAVIALFVVSPAARADEVTLSATGGDLSISGTLLSFDGENYRIDTIYGVVTVNGAAVDCTGPGCPAAGAFVAEWMVSGAAAGTGTLIPALLEGFAAREGLDFVRQQEDATHFLYVLRDAGGADVARVRFRVTTSAEGFADLVAEQADIIAAFREPLPEERARAREAGIGDLTSAAQSAVLALDGIVPVTAPDATVAPGGIALKDLAAIAAGQITNWADLGGPDAPINLHLPGPGSALPAEFAARVLAPRNLTFAPGHARHLDRDSLFNALASDPMALGLVAYADRGDLRMLGLRGGCGAVMSARGDTLASEDYPLTVPHYLYVPRRRLPAITRRFLSFVRSLPAQGVIREAGFVDQAIRLTPLDRQGGRLARAILSTASEVGAPALRRMVSALDGAARMTPTFRFEDGSADLDAPSRSNVALVARAIESGAYKGRTILVAGFSDGMGGASANLALSRERAEAVRTALTAALAPGLAESVTLEAEGFGEALPMACDEDAWGRQVNRRVELWLKPRL